MKRFTILNYIEKQKGKFFTVEFIKKDGTLRRMNCRTGVKKYLKNNGKQIKITPANDNGILRVFEVSKSQYRSINIDTIKRITFDKITLKF